MSWKRCIKFLFDLHSLVHLLNYLIIQLKCEFTFRTNTLLIAAILSCEVRKTLLSIVELIIGPCNLSKEDIL